jgi:site-specific DNA recombinase
MKYFIYCRKSSEEEERQALSIESQLQELREFAHKENLRVIREYTEAKSAKTPGREIFDQMLEAIENGEAEGILSWHPDRLSRNASDSGQIIHLIDIGKIQALKFPTFWTDLSPQGKFNLSIAFSQAKYYSDNLRENVKRGIRAKVRRGEFPGRAPIGYYNHPKTRTIEPDPKTFDQIKYYLEKFSQGNINQADLIREMSAKKFTTRYGQVLNFAGLENILRNPFYTGLFKLKGELHQGSHKAMISKETYDKIQNLLDGNPKKQNYKRYSENVYDFYFQGLARCGTCGYAFTQEAHKKKSGLVFKYYRCTKKSKTCKCKEKPINEKDLSNQVIDLMNQVSIPDYWSEKFLKQIQEWREEEFQQSQTKIRNLNQELKILKNKIEKVLDLHIEGEITAEEYKEKKNKLVNTRKDLEAKIQEISNKGATWIEPLEDFVITSNQANKSVLTDDLHLANKVLKKIGSNYKISEKKLSYIILEPFNFLIEHHSMTGCGSIPDEMRHGNKLETQPESSVYSGEDVRRTARHCYTAGSEWHAKHAASCASSPKGCEPLASAKSEGAEGKWWTVQDLNL